MGKMPISVRQIVFPPLVALAHSIMLDKPVKQPAVRHERVFD
jgi:hypothetical protein